MKISLSMSYSRAEAIRHIKATASGSMRYHIGYLILYPNTIDNHKWISELLSPLENLQDYTNIKGGTFSKSDVMKFLFDEPLGSERQVKLLIARCTEHMHGKQPSGDISKLGSVYESICDLVLGDQVITMKQLEAIFS